MATFLKLRKHGKPVSGVQHYSVVGAADCADKQAQGIYADETEKENNWTDERGNKQTTGDNAFVMVELSVEPAAARKKGGQ